MQRLRALTIKLRKGSGFCKMANTERTQQIEKQVKEWAMKAAAKVDVLAVEQDSMKISVAGMRLVVSLPAAFLSGHRKGKAVDDGDQFFVTAATYECQMEDVLQRLNEKLERLVPADCTVATLMEKLVGTVDAYRKPEQDEEPAGGTSDLDSDYYPEEVADMSVGGAVSEEYDEDDEAPDFYGYDMATGDDVASEREVRVRKASFLHKIAEQARFHCAEAGESDEVFAEGSPYSVLQWCMVESLPDLLRVKLAWDLEGLMDKAGALALGLVYEAPLVASLAFSASLWAEPSLPVNKKFVPEQVHVSQDMASSRRESGAMDLDDQELGSRAQKERGAYGVNVLVPELIHRFFRAHSRIRSPHIDDEASVLTLVNFGVDFPRASLLVRHARATSSESKPLDLTALVHSQYTNAELEKELGAINRAELGCVDEGLAVEENVFTALLQMVGARLAKASTWCPICRHPHASPGMRLRPCNNDLCLYRFEELGLGAAILPEVLDNPELVELELAMAAMAASSARADAVFEPFPSFLLEGRENRGRAGWFNATPSPTSAKAAKKPVAANAQVAAGGSAEKATKMLAQLREALEAVPPLAELTACRNEAAVINALVNGWYMRPSYKMQEQRARQRAVKEARSQGLPAPSAASPPERDPRERASEMLPYDVVRFVLSSNRLSLRHLPESELLPVPGPATQFVVLAADPEKEAAFAQLRAAHGSFFAFHGSKGENWYSIVRNGLRSMSGTSYQLCGAAHGPGIYMAPALATSAGYCATVNPTGWANGTFKAGFTCVAICEVIQGATNGAGGGFCFVMPPGKEDHVIIRYILMYNGPFISPTAETISGDKLGTFSLSAHFQSVTQRVRESRLAQQAERHRARKQQAKQAAAEAAAQAAALAAREAEKRWEAEEAERRASSARGSGLQGAAQGSTSATKAIQKELAKMFALQTGAKGQSSLPAGGFEVELPEEENLYRWRVKLRPSLFAGSTLEADLHAAARLQHVAEVPVLLEIRFPPDFPWQPPFIRVVSPRFAFHTGHVTVGGSICMELLTASGWTPAYALESVLVQIIAEMMHGNARLDRNSLQRGQEYSEEEAKAAFTRVARDHGWKV